MMGDARGRALLVSLKAAAGAPGPEFCLPVGKPPRAWLRTVATRHGFLNPADVGRLTEWRNRFATAFLTEFTATEAQTARWLNETVGPDDTKILFMVDDANGRTFGYMGVAFIDWEKGSGEADAIVRAEPAPRGTMTDALRTLLDWARGQLGLAQIRVRVRSDNPALEFYRRFGFQELKRVALRREAAQDNITWVEDASTGVAPVSLVHLILPA